MNIERFYNNLDHYLKPGKVLVIYGPRQAGKTTLVKKYLANTHYHYKFNSGDDLSLQRLFDDLQVDHLQAYTQGYDLIVIDEAQMLPHVGIALKILVDHMPELRIIVTGSSSFELAGQIGEPLTGRKRTLSLYPVAQCELIKQYNSYELKQQLENYLIFGSYPEVLTAENRHAKQQILIEIMNSYLFKDILAFDKIKSSKTLINLLRLLAFQIGSEVSLTELAQKLSIDYKTVARYIDLLEKTFVIISLQGFSRNLRNEITKKHKYYFCDNGIRNSLIANHNQLDLRNDVGMLWENFLVTERLKKQSYEEILVNNYFWRTWEKAEIDWIEEREGKLFAYEFKWNKKTCAVPKQWKLTYSESEFHVINQKNYLSFIT